MNTTYAIIPVKPFVWLKGDLALRLSEAQLEWLRTGLFEQTLKTLMSLRAIRDVLVLSWDTRILSLARQLGAYTVQEDHTADSDLNDELLRVTQLLKVWKADSVLVVPADLPLLTPDDVNEVISLGRNRYSVVVAPDRFDEGTNMLMVRPPGFIPFVSGPDSFERYRQMIQEKQFELHVYRSERVALDIDSPEDLFEYYALMNGVGQARLQEG